ncbi:hypothetical protein SGGMMB4_01378 [Sodalis glossinidius str. 'morsitans']|nr:hypothetical protein SGGMMB4_01378 [Sodalis glossinidius str. 'morsitans']
MRDAIASIPRQMALLLDTLARAEGYTRSLLEGIQFMRAEHPLERTPVLYDPCIVIVCQGRKRGYLAEKGYCYDQHHYLVLSVPLQFLTETEASPQYPLLAVAIALNMAVLSELVMWLDRPGTRACDAPEGIIYTPLDAAIADTTLRLLQALASKEEARILGPQVVRELYYRVLVGERGNALRAALANQGHFAHISRSLERIHRGLPPRCVHRHAGRRCRDECSCFP